LNLKHSQAHFGTQMFNVAKLYQRQYDEYHKLHVRNFSVTYPLVILNVQNHNMALFRIAEIIIISKTNLPSIDDCPWPVPN